MRTISSLLLFLCLACGTGIAQTTSRYTIHLTPSATLNPTPDHTKIAAPARLTDAQKSDAFKQIVTEINKQPELQTALLGGAKGAAFPAVQKLTSNPSASASLGSAITLTPGAAASSSVAYLEFFKSEALYGYPAMVAYNTPNSALEVVFSTRQPHTTYMIDVAMTTTATSMNVVLHYGAAKPVPMTLPVTEGHMLIPIFAENAEYYIAEVLTGSSHWTFHSAEITQVQ